MDAMDWEPEIPGQWNTPLRLHHQLRATQADSSKAQPQVEIFTLKEDIADWNPEVRAELNRSSRKRAAAEAGILETVLDPDPNLPAAVIQQFYLKPSVFAPLTKIIATTFHIFTQVYSATLKGVGITRESVLATAGHSHVIEERRITADGFQSVKRRAIESGRMIPVTPITQIFPRGKRYTSQQSIARPPFRQSEHNQMAYSEESMAKRVSTPSGSTLERLPPPRCQAQEPPAGREALGAHLWASFTPAPISGSRDSLAISQQPLMPLASSVVESCVFSISQGMIPTSHNENLEQNKAMSSKFERHDESSQIKPSLKKSLNGNESLKLSNKNINKSSRLQNRRSLPLFSDVEISSQLTRSHTVSETPSRRARFAIDPFNGQPQEKSVKFFKDSKIGEWAPSSPWVDEQTLALTSDLKHNLDALLTEDPIIDPVSITILASSESSVSNVNVPFVQDGNFVSTTQDKGMPYQIPLKSPSDLNQITVSENLVDENPFARAPKISLVTDSPFLRIKKLVRGSFIKVFSPQSNGLLSGHVNTNISQEVMEDSVESIDVLSQTSESNCTSPIYDVTGVMDEYPSGVVDGIEDFDILQQKEDRSTVDLEVEMSKLKMSNFAKEKLGRKRMEREAVAAKRKAEEEAAAAKAKAKAEEAERKANSHRRLPKEKLVRPLNKEWEAKIREAMNKSENVALTTTVSGTELRRKDLVTVLGARQWLNDEIINAYLEWIVDYANRNAGKSGRNATPKAIAHNSFFYKNIATQGPQSVSRWMKRKRAEGKKLLEVDTVLIPVNNASHWTIIVVSPKDRTIEYLDSFSGPSKVFVRHTKEWLAVELGHDWHEEEWRVLNTQSAEQLNGFDCGVFLLTNAECVVGGIATDSYDWNDMAAQRHRIAAVLLNRGFGNDIIPAEEL